MISLFPVNAPLVAGYSFDAVLEDTLELNVELTDYPVESGVRPIDHAIIQPIRWSIVAMVGVEDLRGINSVGLASGVFSNALANNALVSFAAGLSAGFLAGNSSTRASAALQFMIELMTSRVPFDVDAVDVQLKNMLITRLRRTKEPNNENGLMLIADLQELVMRDRISAMGQPTQDQLHDGDPSKTSATANMNRGSQAGIQPSGATTLAVESVVNLEPIPL